MYACRSLIPATLPLLPFREGKNFRSATSTLFVRFLPTIITGFYIHSHSAGTMTITMDHSSQTSRRGAPQNFKTLHYLIIAAVIPTFAFDIPIYAIQRNPGAILGVIMVGISAILSMYRSSLLKRAKSYAQLHEYQVLLPDQDGLERGGSNVGASVGMTDQAEKTLFALVDFVFASSLLVATVLLYAMHGRTTYVRYGRYYWAPKYENPALIVVKTWGSLPIIMTW